MVKNTYKNKPEDLRELATAILEYYQNNGVPISDLLASTFIIIEALIRSSTKKKSIKNVKACLEVMETGLLESLKKDGWK